MAVLTEEAYRAWLMHDNGAFWREMDVLGISGPETEAIEIACRKLAEMRGELHIYQAGLAEIAAKVEMALRWLPSDFVEQVLAAVSAAETDATQENYEVVKSDIAAANSRYAVVTAKEGE